MWGFQFLQSLLTFVILFCLLQLCGFGVECIYCSSQRRTVQISLWENLMQREQLVVSLQLLPFQIHQGICAEATFPSVTPSHQARQGYKAGSFLPNFGLCLTETLAWGLSSGLNNTCPELHCGLGFFQSISFPSSSLFPGVRPKCDQNYPSMPAPPPLYPSCKFPINSWTSNFVLALAWHTGFWE